MQIRSCVRLWFTVIGALIISATSYGREVSDDTDSQPPTAVWSRVAEEEGASEYVQSLQVLARHGDSHAQYELGAAYHKGIGISQSSPLAMHWYLQASEQGNPYAAYNIAYMYHLGEGVKASDNKALDWFDKACADGLAEACDSIKYFNEQVP